jgi:hypothetical protein
MCSPATCKSCGKVTYTGCGQHVDQVMAGVPKSNRCTCDAGKPAKKSLFSWGSGR